MADSNITKKALAGAMKNLMNQKPFSKINVADICAACDMNRKSFYYHFKDKYDLVNWIYYTEFTETVYSPCVLAESNTWDLFYLICDYFRKNRKFYINALSVRGQNSFREYFREVLHPVIQYYLSDVEQEMENKDLAIAFFTDSFANAVERWMTETPYLSPEEFVNLMKNIVSVTSRRIAADDQ
jgi:Transcriptional regulator